MLKAAVLNPIARASEETASTVTPGFRNSVRKASRSERGSGAIMVLGGTSPPTNHMTVAGIAAFVGFFAAALPAQDATALHPWRQVWSDEFEGPANSAPDRGKWT